MLSIHALNRVKDEILRYQRAEKALRERMIDDDDWNGTRQSAALRRASLDLSRALTDLRNTKG